MENNEKKNVVESNIIESKNVKLYSVLSYIGILWIIGLLVKEKDNKSLRFHAGQGMLLTVISFGSNILIRVMSSLLLNVGKLIFGEGLLYGLIVIGLFLISLAVTIAIFAFMVIGIMNAANGKDSELPYIGKYAFYK